MSRRRQGCRCFTKHEEKLDISESNGIKQNRTKLHLSTWLYAGKLWTENYYIDYSWNHRQIFAQTPTTTWEPNFYEFDLDKLRTYDRSAYKDMDVYCRCLIAYLPMYSVELCYPTLENGASGAGVFIEICMPYADKCRDVRLCPAWSSFHIIIAYIQTGQVLNTFPEQSFTKYTISKKKLHGGIAANWHRHSMVCIIAQVT